MKDLDQLKRRLALKMKVIVENEASQPSRSEATPESLQEVYSKAKQFRCFVATCNNCRLPDHLDMLLDLDYEYFVAGKEVGKSGTPHLQCYVEMKKRITFGALHKLLVGFHIEQRRGTQAEAIAYCKKDGDFVEYGTPRAGSSSRTVKELRDEIGKGLTVRSLFDDDDITSSQLRNYENMVRYFEPKRCSDQPTVVDWYYGSSGSGKTRTCRQLYPDAYVHHGNLKWWEGYDGHAEIIIDDFRPHQMVDYEAFLGLLDRHEFRVETKGGSRQMRAQQICVTSLHHPGDMFRQYFRLRWEKDYPTEKLSYMASDVFEDYFESEYSQLKRRLSNVYELEPNKPQEKLKEKVTKISLLDRILKK